ncbi:glycosyl transferase family 2 [Salinilacihabitans rarus]|uniref:glycosyl transferase family 2 n=1 Tax=Salinilacihabitans rarus TaxID=2961596 RepID=UPI0020C85128|nr:glycosyl transferase family 2 [Salinilacihabitans rarus]
MEYTQERIATLHDFGGDPGRLDRLAAPLRETAVVVPMTAREHDSPAAAGVLAELERLDVAAVVVPVRAAPDRIGPVREWLASFDLPLSVLWCNAPAVEARFREAGLPNGAGKGRDVWLALGPAADAAEYVVVHDADAKGYEAEAVARLLAPLAAGYAFSKGYYARVEDGRLYGRLFRLLYAPLLEALADAHDAPVVDYLGAFRYALAGEFGVTAPLARRLRPPPAWGIEVGTLGDAFDHAGFEGTAQVDLGRHEHDHRAVAGESGLEGMSREVAAELLRVLEERGVAPDYGTLPDRYRGAGEALVDRYAADAAFNGLAYDPAGEREQVARYAASIRPPGEDSRLPRWVDAPVAPGEVLDAARPWRRAGTGAQD